MRADRRPEIVQALIARREQIKMRLAMGVGIAVAVGGLVGWVKTSEWFCVWTALQIIEFAVVGRIVRRGTATTRFGVNVGLALIFNNNLVFGLIALLALMTGDPWAMVVGGWILAGALLNASPSSRTSNEAFIATVSPLAIYCFAAPILALRAQVSPADLVALMVGATMLLVAALAVRGFSVEALKREESANSAKSTFLATMSHEIRTPLNGVLGMAQAMAGDELSERQRDRLSVIHRSGEALLAILNDVLDLSKIEAGKLELEQLEFELVEVARGAYSAFTALANKKGLSFALDIEGARGRYLGDPTRLRQILYNLISNALKFTEQGEIRVTARRQGGILELSVKDTGVGIAAESLSKLFAKFDQLDSSTTRRFGGTGLGLAICRELAQLMAGEIDVQSELGLGSTFTLRVPLRWMGEEKAVATVAESMGERPEIALRVLAAEDNAVNQLVLKTLLHQMGVEPTVVENGQLAVAAWESGDWDVILMDIQMPVMDGLTATAQIRNLEADTGRPRTPIVALTANAMSHQVERYAAAGMDGHVAKPIQATELFAALTRAVVPEQAKPGGGAKAEVA
jgi:signal transduction histidine kinase/ActR/RegA family two-component response regulator